jgi:hypothetical protein
MPQMSPFPLVTKEIFFQRLASALSPIKLDACASQITREGSALLASRILRWIALTSSNKSVGQVCLSHSGKRIFLPESEYCWDCPRQSEGRAYARALFEAS